MKVNHFDFSYKEEARKQFDKDNDVFYPFAKNKIISNGQTFRDLLLDKCVDGNHLSNIEAALPLLNILVPDYSWVGAFSLVDWDISDKEVAVAVMISDSLRVYCNGVYSGVLSDNEFPDFPVLVLKENERMRIAEGPDTRSGNIEYEFIDDAFNGECYPTTTRISSEGSYIDLYEYEEPNPYVLASELEPAVIEAYNICKGDDFKYQRDYIYYGIRNSTEQGRLNTKWREYLYKIKFVNSNNGGLIDSNNESDPFRDGYFPTTYTKKGGGGFSVAELKEKDFRIEGALELRFKTVYSQSNGVICSKTTGADVKVSDLFDYNRIHVETRHLTALVWRRKRTYTINKDCLVPKWCVVNVPLAFSPSQYFDLHTTSSIISINIEDYDSGEKTTRTIAYTDKMAANVTTESSEQVKLSGGISTEHSESHNTSIETTNNSDNFLDTQLDYLDDIILSKDGNKYKMKVYSTGIVDLMILPRKN